MRISKRQEITDMTPKFRLVTYSNNKLTYFTRTRKPFLTGFLVGVRQRVVLLGGLQQKIRLRTAAIEYQRVINYLSVILMNIISVF